MYEWGLGIVGIDRRIDWKDLLETPLSCRLEDSYIRKVMELCEDDFNKLMNECMRQDFNRSFFYDY